jgi:O-methyltransferase
VSSLSKAAKKVINTGLQEFGFQLERFSPHGDYFTAVEASAVDEEIYKKVQAFTMSNPDPIYSLITATRYIVENQIKGDFVECGIWRGGCSMAVALTLLELGDTSRKIWLYDTFSGMTEPGIMDVSFGEDGMPALPYWKNKKGSSLGSDWANISLNQVKINLNSTSYPSEKIRFIKGDVLETLNGELPENVALLRLDTDWYQSTKKELSSLYPKLSTGGICIVDDYGAWAGSKQAVDEYFTQHHPRPLMHITDWTTRTWVKTPHV